MSQSLCWYVCNCLEIQERPVRLTRDFHSDMRKVLPSIMFGESCVAYEQSSFDRYTGSNTALDGLLHEEKSDAIAKADDLRAKQIKRLKEEKIRLEGKIAELESTPLRITTYRELIDRGMEMERDRLEKLIPSTTRPAQETEVTK